MNKKEFLKFIRHEIKDVPSIEKIQAVNKYIGYLLSLKEEYQKQWNKKLETYFCCKNCCKLFKKNPKNYKSKTRIVHGVCISTDCGYGDDDILADVTYEDVYVVCPYCGEDLIIKTFVISAENERTRR